MDSFPLKWHGGKNAFHGKLAKWIISLMPKHVHYVEPYFGGGAVLLHKDPTDISEVANDLNGELMNFWQVLAKTPDRMLRQLWATPMSEPVFDAAFQELADKDAVRRATAFFIRVRQSRQGLMKDFATLSRRRVRGGMNEQASAWWSAIEGLMDAHNRLKGVVIRCKPALEVIRQEDTESTLFYLDPPYLQETRSEGHTYDHELTAEDHRQLLEALAGIKGKFILSGYPSDLYEQARLQNNWNRREFHIVNNASGKAVKDVKTECVWFNYPIGG